MKDDLWGPLAGRYTAAGPRRMLALDGGGIRGILTLEILAEMELQLAAITGTGDRFRLCQFFDYIAGTSTGAIIAAGLALGMSTSELIAFYKSIGPQMFEKDHRLDRLRHVYSGDPLTERLQSKFGVETTLHPDRLRCLLLVVTRDVITDSPWPISSSPVSKCNDRQRADCNLQIPLWRLVRASTAAPGFFPPEVVEWEKGNPKKSFVFVDGATTPYNNPAFLCFRMATSPEYRLLWPTGEDRLMLVSVGTGASAPPGPNALVPETHVASTLLGLPGALMGGASVDQDINCRTIGRCVHGAAIDRELGDMIPREGDARIPLPTNIGRAFLYARYNVDLSENGLAALGLPDVDPASVQTLDAVDGIEDLARVGRVAAKQVNLAAHFGPLVAGVAGRRP
jgi:hypothetical protein